MMASSTYSSSPPPRIIIGYSNQQQQQQSATTSSITTLTTSTSTVQQTTNNSLSLSQQSTPKPGTQIYRLPSNFVYSNQNYSTENVMNNDHTEMKNHIFVHNKNGDHHIERGYSNGITERTSNELLHKNQIRILMYPSSNMESSVTDSNNSDTKLIVNGNNPTNAASLGPENGVKILEANYGDTPAQILVQNHQSAQPGSVASTSQHHYSVISPYAIQQTNLNGGSINGGNVEYVVLHENDDSDRNTTNTGDIQSHQQHYASAPHINPIQMQVERRAGQDNLRRLRNLEAKRRRLENETEEDRARRRARDAETKRARRQRETSEQRARRLMRDSQRMRRTRRIKRLLGPTATLSDLKRTGLTLEDLDSYNAGGKQRRSNIRSPHSSQYSANSQLVQASQIVSQTTQNQGPATFSYETIPPQHSSQIRYSNASTATMVPISSTTASVATLASGATVVNGAAGSGYVTLHVTLPPGSDSQQPQILHLPATHALPQHIIVQRTPPPPVQQTIQAPIQQVVTTSHRQQTPPQRQLVQQRVLTSTPQITTISNPIVQEKRIGNARVQQMQHPVSGSVQHQQHNSHPQHSVVYRTAPPEEYEIDEYKGFIIQQPPPPQHVSSQHNYSNSNVPTTSNYQPQERIRSKNSRNFRTSRSNANYSQRSGCNVVQSSLISGRISERFKGLTEDQILRRRRANAERSRRRRQLETPDQRQERNRRTAERMRARRARLAEERLTNKSGGSNNTSATHPTPRQIIPLSSDRFEEIFLSVLDRCRNSSLNDDVKKGQCTIKDEHFLTQGNDDSQYLQEQEQQPTTYSSVVDSPEDSILHTQMCATPSYIISNDQDDNNFAFELGSDRNEQQNNSTSSEYLQHEEGVDNNASRDSANFLEQDVLSQTEKPIDFLVDNENDLQKESKLSFPREEFSNDRLSMITSFIHDKPANNGDTTFDTTSNDMLKQLDMDSKEELFAGSKEHADNSEVKCPESQSPTVNFEIDSTVQEVFNSHEDSESHNPPENNKNMENTENNETSVIDILSSGVDDNGQV